MWRPVFSPRSCHTKDSKMVRDASLLNSKHYKVKIKGKWSNPEKGILLTLTPLCCSYGKGSLRVTLDSCRPTYIYMCVWVCVCERERVKKEKIEFINEKKGNSKRNKIKFYEAGKFTHTHTHTHTYIYIWIYMRVNSSEIRKLRGSLNKFPDFFRMGTFIDSTHLKL